MYALQIKDSAVSANEAVGRLVAAEGRRHAFETRAAAEDLARRLSDRGRRVRVQKAAPQDPADVDGYLVAQPQRFHAEPKATERPGLTFDVGANLYGELGRALVYGTYGVSPAVKHYLYDRVPEIDERRHRIEAVAEPAVPDDVGTAVSWSPDCLFRVVGRPEPDGRRQFFAEIKTGAASFQRGQLEDMRRVARRYAVLKIRVDIRDLPEEYTVRIDRVAAD